MIFVDDCDYDFVAARPCGSASSRDEVALTSTAHQNAINCASQKRVCPEERRRRRTTNLRSRRTADCTRVGLIISVLNLIEFMPSAPPTNSGGRIERTICPGGSNLGVKSRTDTKTEPCSASDQVSNLILLSSRDALASLWIVLSGKKWIPTRPQALSCLTSTGSIEGSSAVSLCSVHTPRPVDRYPG